METRAAHFDAAFHLFRRRERASDLRERAKTKAGDSFELKKFNDSVIAYGSPPVKYVREIIGLSRMH